MAGGCSTSRVWVVIAVAFCIITIGLTCYVIMKEAETKKSAEERIVERYPTLFRTTEQQLRLYNLTTLYTPVRSKAFFRDETSMTTVTDDVKSIAQFGSRKQFFKFEQCSHVANYNYGMCSQNMEYTTAVTVDDDLDEDDDNRYMVEWVKVPGSCKCINT